MYGDAGPVTNLDSDRGLQQDHFGANRAGPSRGGFRTAQGAPSGFEEESARFFSAGPSTSSPPPIAPSPFDLAALRSSLPPPSFNASKTLTPSHSFHGHSWATDFLKNVPKPTTVNPLEASTSPQAYSTREHMGHPSFSHGTSQLSLLFTERACELRPTVPQSQLPMRTMPQMSSFVPLAQTISPNEQLENAFQSLEQQQKPVTMTSGLESQAEQSQNQSASQSQDADLLARTAGLLVQSVDHESNPKFANSQFLGLMKQLRDRTAIVQGNDIVSAPPDWQLGQGDTVSAADPKGKGKAVPSFVAVTQGPGTPQLQAPSSTLRMAEQDANIGSEEDANEAYFRQDNEDYSNYWKAHHTPIPIEVAPSQEWQQLQRDWDRFEATSTGVRPILLGYQFQQGNPYLLGERSYNHTMHTQGVLQMEAAVQRDPNNPQAWFELGVKQQENERERQAISALQRALQLDPAHLPSWLALAISYTNEGDRHGTYQAVQSWVRQNERYRDIVSAFEAHGTGSDAKEEFQKLISCLIAMARGNQSAEVDADVQIALATLLNTNEDWLLYNRVGATLANGGRAEEALPYYYRALEINPAYIRARFNLGISCINLKRYEEAAQHILDALVLQESDGLRGLEDKHDVTSNALWDSLKTCCLQMQRVDLAMMCDYQDLEGLCLSRTI
ncbi:hypothetical protein BJY52DRAFT_1204739 [Lactarius psammicola]|nr:hypothetical protein BJY52DRAFT_1204739 [Lactarius psammicola]